MIYSICGRMVYPICIVLLHYFKKLKTAGGVFIGLASRAEDVVGGGSRSPRNAAKAAAAEEACFRHRAAHIYLRQVR